MYVFNSRRYDEEDIEKIFYTDVRDKKRTGRGIFSKTGNGVKHKISGVKFPYDLLTAKEKRALNGEMIVVSGLGKLMTMEEFNLLDKQKKKDTLVHWRSLHKTKKIMEALNIENNAYYRLLYDLEIIPRPESSYQPKTATNSRYGHLVVANKSDIISYSDFQKLSNEEKFKILNEYGELYLTESIGKIWGIEKDKIYNMKYVLKKKVQPSNKERVDKKMKDNTQQNATPSTNESNTRIQVIANNNENVGEQLTLESEHNLVESSPVQQPQESNYSQEIAELRNLIFEQGKMFTEMMAQQQVAATTQNVPTTQQQVQAQQPMPTYVVEPVKQSEMIFSFEDQKEGFLLHQDIQRFIAVLERNPDIFNVEIKITRK